MKNIEWNFGTLQAKVKAVDGVLYWSYTGKKGSYPIEAISGIQYESGLLLGHFVVLASGGKNEKIQIPANDESKKIIQDINNYIREYKAHTTRQSLPQTSVADELLKLKQLKDAGILNEEEFDVQKTKVLDGGRSIASGHKTPSYTAATNTGPFHYKKKKPSSAWYWVLGILAFIIVFNLLIDKPKDNVSDTSGFIPKIEAFKDPYATMGALNSIGIGSLTKYSGDLENGYFSASDYYVLEQRRPEQGLANNLMLYLESKSLSYVKTVKLILHINNPSNRKAAVREFKKNGLLMIKALGLENPKGLEDALSTPKVKSFSSDMYTIDITLDDDRIQTWKLLITSK